MKRAYGDHYPGSYKRWIEGQALAETRDQACRSGSASQAYLELIDAQEGTQRYRLATPSERAEHGSDAA
jgi:hypothetical protein